VPASEPAPLHVREAGRGEPVLLLHGLGGDHTQWNLQLTPLAESYHVLAPDLRGHGLSPAPEGSTLDFAEMEADLLGTLESKGVGAAHLVGLSAGGFLALRLALGHPEKVRSLALVASAAHCDGHTKSVMANWAEVYRDEGFDAYVVRLVKDVHSAEWLEQHMETIDQARQALSGRDLRPAALWAQAIRSFDVRSQLGRMRIPTYAIHGMDDRVIDPSHSRLLRQAIRGAELKLFPYVGHLVPIERPEETTALLQGWLAKAGAPGEQPGPTGPARP
jgi:3-oxoadipate enol-lactonase